MKFSVFSVNSHTAVISVSNFLHFSNEILVVKISISKLINTLKYKILSQGYLKIYLIKKLSENEPESPNFEFDLYGGRH